MSVLRSGTPKDAGLNPDRIKDVIDLCESWVENGSTPALITLVARHGVIFLHQAWGKQGTDPNSPNATLDTIFGVASVSKSVTATAVMILVERGQLGLDQQVQAYLPEFKGDGFERVTIRHLLTHTSGLPDNVDIPIDEFGKAGNRISPGEEAVYSNTGYALLGDIVEQVSNKPFAEFAHSSIFEPLGMKDATFVLPLKTSQRYMQPRPGTTFDWPDEMQGATYASSTLNATAMDMAIFGQTFLNRGTYGDVQLLSPASISAMTTDQVSTIPRERVNGIEIPPSGFGWFMLEQCRFPQWPTLLSPESYGHSGASGALLWVDPRYDLVGVFLFVKISEEFWPKDLFVDGIIRSIVS